MKTLQEGLDLTTARSDANDVEFDSRLSALNLTSSAHVKQLSDTLAADVKTLQEGLTTNQAGV